MGLVYYGTSGNGITDINTQSASYWTFRCPKPGSLGKHIKNHSVLMITFIPSCFFSSNVFVDSRSPSETSAVESMNMPISEIQRHPKTGRVIISASYKVLRCRLPPRSSNDLLQCK